MIATEWLLVLGIPILLGLAGLLLALHVARQDDEPQDDDRRRQDRMTSNVCIAFALLALGCIAWFFRRYFAS